MTSETPKRKAKKYVPSEAVLAAIAEFMPVIEHLKANARELADLFGFTIMSHEIIKDGEAETAYYLIDPKGRVVVGRDGKAGLLDIGSFLNDFARDFAIMHPMGEAA